MEKRKINKKEGNGMETRQRVIEEYVEKCPYCSQGISGFSESAVRYKMKLHIQSKHPKKEK